MGSSSSKSLKQLVSISRQTKLGKSGQGGYCQSAGQSTYGTLSFSYFFSFSSSSSSSSFQSVCPALITTADSCGQALRHCNLLRFWAQNWQSQCHIMKLKKEKANETSATSRTNRQYLSLLSDEPPSTRWPADVRSSFWPLRVCLEDKKKEERK